MSRFAISKAFLAVSLPRFAISKAFLAVSSRLSLSVAIVPIRGTLPAAAIPDHACTTSVLSLQELGAAGISVAAIDHAGDDNPVDKIWGEARPPAPQSPVRIHNMEYAGETVKDKLAKVGVF